MRIFLPKKRTSNIIIVKLIDFSDDIYGFLDVDENFISEIVGETDTDTISIICNDV